MYQFKLHDYLLMLFNISSCKRSFAILSKRSYCFSYTIILEVSLLIFEWNLVAFLFKLKMFYYSFNRWVTNLWKLLYLPDWLPLIIWENISPFSSYANLFHFTLVFNDLYAGICWITSSSWSKSRLSKVFEFKTKQILRYKYTYFLMEDC